MINRASAKRRILIREMTLPQSQLIRNWDTLVSVCRKPLGIPPPTTRGGLPPSTHGIPGASSSQLRGEPGIWREGWRCWASGGAASVHRRVSPHPLEWVVDSTRGPKETPSHGHLNEQYGFKRTNRQSKGGSRPVTNQNYKRVRVPCCKRD